MQDHTCTYCYLFCHPNWQKRGNFLQFYVLKTKEPNLHTFMQLSDTVLVFDSVEYVGNGKGGKDMFKHLLLIG